MKTKTIYALEIKGRNFWLPDYPAKERNTVMHESRERAESLMDEFVDLAVKMQKIHPASPFHVYVVPIELVCEE